jgi:hypothetical protein
MGALVLDALFELLLAPSLRGLQVPSRTTPTPSTIICLAKQFP